jgi:hypothetical protein
MRSQFKSLMESGAVYLKMIASQFSTASAQLRYRLQVNYLFSPENKKPAETSAGFLLLIMTSTRQTSASDPQGHVNGRGRQRLLVLHQLDARIQLLQL